MYPHCTERIPSLYAFNKYFDFDFDFETPKSFTFVTNSIPLTNGTCEVELWSRLRRHLAR